MSGVLGQKLGRKNSTMGGRVSSVMYAVNSGFDCRQVKYVYDWLKPRLASAYISVGRVNASARKITSGYAALTSARQNCQNASGLVCGLSTRKTRRPCSHQKRKMLV